MSNKLKKSNKNILVIGLGLIGASLCRALKDGKKYEKIIQTLIIPAVNGYQNFGILCGFEFENIPCSLLFGFTHTLCQKLL